MARTRRTRRSPASLHRKPTAGTSKSIKRRRLSTSQSEELSDADTDIADPDVYVGTHDSVVIVQDLGGAGRVKSELAGPSGMDVDHRSSRRIVQPALFTRKIVSTREIGIQAEETQELVPVGSNSGSIDEAVAGPGISTHNNLSAVAIRPEATQLYDDMKARLECPVCCKISLPPVMQCRNGHVTCNSCRLKVRSCPMCREVDIDVRNLFAEKAVSYMTIPCEFSLYGCKVETPYREKDVHLRVCKHRPYNCPYIECEHKFVAGDVVTHVASAHKDDCRNSEGPEITASMILIGNYFGGDGAWSPRVITCFGRTFFDVALTRDRWLHHWVWLLGEEEEAQGFTYEITAFKGESKYMYAGEVASLRIPDEEIVSTGQCLSINDAIGKRLRDGDKIRYKLKLSRKERALNLNLRG